MICHNFINIAFAVLFCHFFAHDKHNSCFQMQPIHPVTRHDSTFLPVFLFFLSNDCKIFCSRCTANFAPAAMQMQKLPFLCVCLCVWVCDLLLGIKHVSKLYIFINDCVFLFQAAAERRLFQLLIAGKMHFLLGTSINSPLQLQQT